MILCAPTTIYSVFLYILTMKNCYFPEFLLFFSVVQSYCRKRQDTKLNSNQILTALPSRIMKKSFHLQIAIQLKGTNRSITFDK